MSRSTTPSVSHPPSRPGTSLSTITAPCQRQQSSKVNRSITTGLNIRRPETAMSMGTTARGNGRAGTTVAGGTVRDIEEEGDWVVAVIQAKVRGIEIGIASYDLHTGHTILTQLSDGQTFPRTIHHLSLHPPSRLVVPDTFLPGHGGGGAGAGRMGKRRATDEAALLVRCLEDRFDVGCEGVERKKWNPVEGLAQIDKYILEDERRPAVLMAAGPKHYALSALAALYAFLELELGIQLAGRSQRIVYQALEGTMFIDPDTAKNLELVRNTLNPRSSKCLYGIMNVMQTKMAQRLLRSTILQPSIEPAIVEGRLDVVEELTRSEELFKGLKSGLKAFQNMDIEKLIAQLTQTSAQRDPRAAETRLGQLLQLRSIVRSVGPLIEALWNCRSELLVRARQLLSDQRCAVIDDLLSVRINDDAISHQGKVQNQKALRIYAVRANYNKLLDVARETHKDNEADIYELKGELSVEHNLNLELRYTEKGFEFWTKAESLDGDLPKVFTGVRKLGPKIHFTCSDLMKLNARMKASEDEVFLMSDGVVLELREALVQHIACLYNISEALAKIDMLVGFAQIAIEHEYRRPEFKDSVAIKDGRHPILDKTLQGQVCIPNNTCIEEKTSAFLLVQGPNMSGKSTYLKQVALLTVMALCGSFVPAEYACFRYHDALLSRLSNDDSIEKSLSTFAVEMATSAMILGLATNRSLVIIDELGRGTAPSEGAGLSHAIAEELIKRKSFVLFATHFKDLAQTLAVYPSVEIMHLYTKRNKEAKKAEHALVYEHKVVRGQLREEHYGLELAKAAALPPDVLETAQRVSVFLDEQEEKGKRGSEMSAKAGRRKAMLSLQHKLQSVLAHSALGPTSTELREVLIEIQKECYKRLVECQREREEGKERAENEQERMNGMKRIGDGMQGRDGSESTVDGRGTGMRHEAEAPSRGEGSSESKRDDGEDTRME